MQAPHNPSTERPQATAPAQAVHRLLEHALAATDAPPDVDDDFVVCALVLYLHKGDAAFNDLSPHAIKALLDHTLRIVDLSVLEDAETVSNWLISRAA